MTAPASRSVEAEREGTGNRSHERAEGKPRRANSKKKALVILAIVLAVGGGGYTFVKPAAPASAEPEPGVVVKLSPVTLNLDAGRYLKVGMALQFTEAGSSGGAEGEVDAEPDGAKALDVAIDQLSNRKVAELNTAVGRRAAKDALLAAVAEAYHGDVMDLYFTEFVMQ